MLVTVIVFMAESLEDYYMVWGIDQTAYGPVDLATLESWIADGRVTAENWVFAGKTGTWQKARKLAQVRGLFGMAGDTTRLSAPAKIDPSLLRSVKVLQGLTENQLAMFAKMTELEKAPEGARVVSEGDTDDSLYFILEGKLAVCLQLMGQEVVLTVLQAGDFFGDIALLNCSARTADVVARSKCLLGKLTAAALDEIAQVDAQASTRFLQAVDEALSERIRADNQRFAAIVGLARAAQ